MTEEEINLRWTETKGFTLVGTDYMDLDKDEDPPWEVLFLMNVFFILADRSAHGNQMRKIIMGYADSVNYRAASGLLVESDGGGQNVQ